MPLKSKAQERYLWATNPDLAREYEKATPRKAREKLPEKAKKPAPKK